MNPYNPPGSLVNPAWPTINPPGDIFIDPVQLEFGTLIVVKVFFA
jgi:hypothetical protein